MSEHERRFGLARALSKAGFCSRSRAAELIRQGRVRLNGVIRRDPETPVRTACDHIEVGGRPLAAATKLYYMLNKPRGLVTTASDEKGRPTVYQHIPGSLPWLSPVGRLDKASEGLLLLTNDSQWAARILSPETHLLKTYHVQINTVADPDFLRRLEHGVVTSEGDLLRVVNAALVRPGEKNSWIEISLDEGKNRHIRRMLGVLGIEVLRLIRIAVGGLQLGSLRKGECRELTTAEKENLDRMMRPSEGRR